jgi:peptidyl-prolyl cis-trans isomerase C
MKRYLLATVAATFLFAGFGCSKQEQKPDKARLDTETSNNILKPRPDSQSTTESTSPQSASDATANNESMVMPSQASQKQQQGKTLKQFFDSLKIPEVVAEVDGKKITKNDLFKEIESQIPQFMRDRPLPPRALAGLAGELDKVVESVVNRKLMLKLAAADGVKPSPQLLAQAFDKYVNGLPPAQRAQFEKSLKAQGSSIAAKRAEAEKDITSQEAVAINKWITEKVLPSLKVDDAEVKKFYKEHLDRFKKPATVKVAHILITPEKPSPEKMKDMTFEQKKAFAENADKKAKNKAEKILAQVKAGADFAKLAKDNSACPSGKFSKGELPAFDKTGATNDRRGGRMDPTFTAASFKLKPGEVSGLVKTPYGYHIIKEIKKNEESTIPYVKVEKNLKENLKKEEMAKKIKALIEKARKENKVKIFLKGPVAVPTSAPLPAKPITL